jgi:predicted ATPase/DNA-binding SARP family transcriptional activator
MRSLRISLLGGFAVDADGRTVGEGAWRLRKSKGLVKLLALAPERRLHREQASELLWPDRDAAAAANNLHQALYVARRALETAGVDGASTVELSDDVLILHGASVDVEEFEAAAAAARGSGRRDLCQAAVELYSGELLPEDRYEEWTAGRREALREQCTALLLELAELEEDGGDSGAAVRWLQRALDGDPLHEGTHRRLMRVFALSGRRQQALAQYQRLRQALRREFEDLPDAETRALYQSILSGNFGASEPEREPREATPREALPAAQPHNLPLRLTSFVGRERELAEVRRLLVRGRLVTLTGPGGCGKTRLAVEAAAGRLRDFPDGVWLVELAPLMDDSLIPHAVGSALGLQLGAGHPPAEALALQLRTRKLLLVLDNCEHLIDSCARLADKLLRSSPELTILATSREPLHVPGELPARVPSLSLPEAGDATTAEALLRCEAGRLFCQRAAEAAPGFEPDGANAAAIAEICIRLDGMPLALELAAARARVLSPVQIAERLGDSLRLLAGGSRTALTRQQTLRATLAWSHDLLTLEERVLFRRLAVFSGSFALDAVEGVCAGDGLDRYQILDLLDRLADKSLAAVLDDQAGDLRYRSLETVRQYAAERLDEAGEREALELRHLEWYERFTSTHVPPPGEAVTGGIPPRLDAEHDNLRGAMAVALRRFPDTALSLAVTLFPWWLARSHFGEGAHALEAALERTAEPSETRAEALLALIALHVRLGDLPDHLHWGEEAIAIRRTHGDRRVAAQALLRMGQYTVSIDPEATESLYAEALVIATRIRDRFLLASIAHARGVLASLRSRYAEASELLLEAAAMLEGLEDEGGDTFPATTIGLIVHDDPTSGRPRLFFEETMLLFRPAPAHVALGYVLGNHAFALRSMGELEAAREPLDRALALFRELGDRPGIALALNQLGNLGRSLGEHALAREWLEEALSIRSELGDRRGIGLTLGNLGLLAGAAGDEERGRLLLSESYERFERTDDGPGQGGALLNLANLELSLGRRAEGRRLLEQCLPFWERQDLVRARAWISLSLADVLEDLDEPDEAARRRQAARELFERIGDFTGLERIKSPLRAG